MISQYRVELIVIGNGTASRETEQFIAELIKRLRMLGSLKEMSGQADTLASSSILL